MMDSQTEGKLAENILHFARTLRSAGLPIGTGQLIDALTAVKIAGIESRRDLYWTLRTVLVQRQTELGIFNQSFHLYFRNPRLLERMMALIMPTAQQGPDDAVSDKGIRRLLEAIGQTESSFTDGADLEFDQAGSYSEREILREKDFEQMTLAEQDEAKKLLAKELTMLGHQRTRRFQADAWGNRYDLGRTLRQMQRGNTDVVALARKRCKTRLPDTVLICDISGSMSAYSRMFLHFAHALARHKSVVHCFVFGTRLTNVSRHLQDRDADKALQLVASDVRDWDGGTRIAECLRDFNRHWSRRVLARGAVVIILSDGLEQGKDDDLGFQMRRLKRSCRRLIWMNPLLRYNRFEAKAGGIRQMLPHVDQFVSAHNLNSISEVLEALSVEQVPVPDKPKTQTYIPFRQRAI